MRRALLRSAALALALGVLAGGGAAAAPAGSPWGEQYFPNVVLTTHEGKKVKFYDDLVRDKHVVVSFVYTRCTKVCGLMTAKLAQVQRELGERVGKDIFFYSISLEPEFDTPERLAKYARAFKLKGGWTFLTGKQADIALLRRKFGDKSEVSEHTALINVGNDRTGQWWTTASLDNPRYLATVIGDWMDPSRQTPGRPLRDYGAHARRLPVQPAGHKLFRERCIACHLAGGEGVGPDLAGVVERRGRPWLARWLKAPDKMLAEKDPIALALLEQAGGIPMPNVNLTDADVEALLDYLAAGEASAAQPAPAQVAAEP